MPNDLKSLFARASGTLLEDALGVVCLFTLFIAGLYLPSVI